MSYAVVPRLGGFGSYNTLPPVDPNSVPSVASYRAQANAALTGIGDQSKAQAVAFAEQQLQNYPSAASVLAEYQEYSGYLKSIKGFNVDDLKDPSKCADLMKQALIAYAKANGYPTTTKEAEQALAVYAASVAASEFGVSIPPNWPSNLKDLKSVAVDLACTAVVMVWGVDPKSLTVVVDALMDGKLSESECTAIGTAAGAIAGAVIGQAFGIPAPIGAFIGGLIGGDIGGTLGEIFGAGPSGTEDMNARLDAAKSWGQAQLAQAQALCTSSRSAYWQTFDQLLLAIELQWEIAEEKIGWRFDLRWFGLETYTKLGQPFSHAWDPNAGFFTGPLTTANRAQQVGRGQEYVTHYTDKNGQDATARSTEYTYGCPYDFGCPYPVVQNLPMPLGSSARVAQAFLARGALWIPTERRNYQCSFKLPATTDLFDDATKRDWITAMCIDLNQEQSAVAALQILSVTVVGDLVKTTAMVAAEKGIYEILKLNAVELNRASLARGQALAQAKATGTQLSDLLNYGVLALGAGLLAATLWKKKRKS
jgi:hypothetical protein